MRLKFFIPAAIALLVLFIAGCNRNQPATDREVKAKIPVTVTHIGIKTLTDYMELTATSKFLNKSVISAHATGYIQAVYHDPGDKVKKGDELFTLQTKEAAALSHDTLNRLEFPGLIHVKAAIDGMIISIDHPEGDFVMEGESLGTISVPASLVFLLEVPFEATSYIKTGSQCEILLPGGDSVLAMIDSHLPTMAQDPQTQQFIVNPITSGNLPENLIAKIRIIRKKVENAVTLPKACILSDEVMKQFWVMKLINDSTAVRVNINTGLREGDNIQVTSPVFTKEDLFLASGNYGVGDTVAVSVTGKMNENVNQ